MTERRVRKAVYKCCRAVVTLSSHHYDVEDSFYAC